MNPHPPTVKFLEIVLILLLILLLVWGGIQLAKHILVVPAIHNLVKQECLR